MSRYPTQGNSPPQFRPVNRLLGSRPTIGPIPADLFIPFGAISLLVSLLSSQVLGLAIEWTLALIIWGCATWWILTGSRPYRFLSKFVAVPQRWSRGHVRYCSLQELRQRRHRSASAKAGTAQSRPFRSRRSRPRPRSRPRLFHRGSR